MSKRVYNRPGNVDDGQFLDPKIMIKLVENMVENEGNESNGKVKDHHETHTNSCVQNHQTCFCHVSLGRIRSVFTSPQNHHQAWKMSIEIGGKTWKCRSKAEKLRKVKNHRQTC